MNNIIKFKHYTNSQTKRVITVVSELVPEENKIRIGFSIFNPKDKTWRRKDGNYFAMKRLRTCPLVVKYLDIFDTYGLRKSVIFRALVVKALYSYLMYMNFFDDFFDKTGTDIVNQFHDMIMEEENNNDVLIYLKQIRNSLYFKGM